MTFKVTILGTSSARPTINRHHSAHALNVHEQFYLIDCGEGTQRRLLENGINPLKINAVFITHLHGDHMYGIFPLISSMGIMGRKTPLAIYAPKPFDELLACHLTYFDANLPFEVQFHEVDTRRHEIIFENKVMEVWTIPLRHRVPAAGYLFKEKAPALNVRKDAIDRYNLSISQIAAAKHGEDILYGDNQTIQNHDITYLPYQPRSYAYCSDTQYSAKAAGIVQGVDLLYHEATFAEKDKALAKETGHSTAAQAAKVALTANAKKLILGHLSSRYKDETLLRDEARTIFQDTEIAQEDKTYEIKPVRHID